MSEWTSLMGIFEKRDQNKYNLEMEAKKFDVLRKMIEKYSQIKQMQLKIINDLEKK